jgi:lysophospholipase L1-like esterase
VHFAKQSWVDTDSEGFRSPELAEPKPPGTLRFAFLGGSTTFNSFASSNDACWSAQLIQGLREAHTDVAFDYLNAGVTGYRVRQSRWALEHRVKQHDPDVIVIYHATNDMAEDSERLAVEAGVIVKSPPPSFLERHSVLWRLIVKNLRYGKTQEAGLDADRKLDFDPTLVSPGYRDRLEQLVREAQEVADLVCVITFTTKFRAEQPLEVQLENLKQSFTFMPYLDPASTLAGYEEYNRRIVEVAEATGALLVDERFSIPGDAEHFGDSVHFTDAGLKLQAARVERALEASAAFQALLEAKRVGS